MYTILQMQYFCRYDYIACALDMYTLLTYNIDTIMMRVHNGICILY